MAQQIDTNILKQAEASTSLAKDMLTVAIEQSAANQTLCEEALKSAATEITQAQTAISQVQTALQSAEQAKKSK